MCVHTVLSFVMNYKRECVLPCHEMYVERIIGSNLDNKWNIIRDYQRGYEIKGFKEVTLFAPYEIKLITKEQISIPFGNLKTIKLDIWTPS